MSPSSPKTSQPTLTTTIYKNHNHTTNHTLSPEKGQPTPGWPFRISHTQEQEGAHTLSRLENKKKAGYFPTPTQVITRIRSHLEHQPEPARILDPCAGEGRALHHLFTDWPQAELLGIELDHERAAGAEHRLDRVLQGSYAAMRLPRTDPGISALFLNPPYDHDSEGGRLELSFLRDTQDWLMPGGLLIYIIPQYRISGYVARRLATHFKDIQIYRFPDPEFEQFRQAVIFGVKRETPVKDDTLTLEIAQAKTDQLPPLPFGSSQTYTVPPKPEHPFYFHTSEASPDDVAQEVIEHGVWNTQAWINHVCPSGTPGQSPASIQPLTPLRRGHIAMVLAAGLLNNMEIENDHQRLLVKGRLKKTEIDVSTETDHENDIQRTRESFQASIHWLDLNDGRIGRVAGNASLQSWMFEWQDQLAGKIVDTFEPLHQMNYDGLDKMVAITDHHSKHRRLPGREATGLFEAQRQVVGALTRHFLQDAAVSPTETRTPSSYAFLQAQMGTGKTTIATSLADVLKKYLKPEDPFPVIVVCPPHLIEKWPREISQIVPLARGHVIRRVSDFEEYVRKVRSLDPRTLQIAVVSSTMLKLGSGWTPAVVEKKGTGRYWHTISHPIENSENDWTISGWATTYHCPRCGEMVTQDVAGAQIPVVRKSYFEDKRLKCQHCGEPLYQDWRGDWPEPDHNIFGQLKPLPEPRYPIADYIAKKYPDFFELAIVDEVHEMKAQSSDRGHAFGVLAGAAKRTLGMTGTLFGGMATSLFYLLHRLDHRVRDDFAWSDGQRFASLYGILEKVRDASESDPTKDAHGIYTGLRRRRTHVKEKPGISPALVTRLLDTTVFLGLEDLGFNLPEYQEEPVTFQMPNGAGPVNMAGHYHRMENELRAAAREDSSLLGQYLQATLCWVNAPWRDEETDIRTYPGLTTDYAYPKERWLVGEVKRQRQRGRRALIYARQTGTRDIQPRLRQILKGAGIRTEILRSSVGTTRRERWLKSRVNDGLDALICNPRLVQTGLDLIDFPTLIFYEPDYSIYLIKQASARSWRLGQTEDVEVYFLAYEDSMEHRAVAHVGQKIAAAQLLYGDDVSGALVSEAGAGGSLLEQLAREVANNAEVPDLGEMFARKTREKESSTQTGWLLGRETLDLSDKTNGHKPDTHNIMQQTTPVIQPEQAQQMRMF